MEITVEILHRFQVVHQTFPQTRQTHRHILDMNQLYDTHKCAVSSFFIHMEIDSNRAKNAAFITCLEQEPEHF